MNEKEKLFCALINKKKVKEAKKMIKNARKQKTYSGEWYNVNSIFGNDWAIFYLLLGGREAGKSYSVMQWATRRKLKLKDKMKFYWFRLTEAACDQLLADGASKLIDPDLQRKFGIKTTRKNKTIYTYAAEDEGKKHKKKDVFAEVLACSTFYNSKGVGYFDNEFDGEYLIVLDEMNREASERNTFDIVYNFVNLVENVARSTKKKIKVVMIGNTLDEAGDLLSAFNFIPDDFGRYKLKSKRAVIDYIQPNEAYLKRRKGTIADILTPEASTFTNELKIDRTLLVNKRLCVAPTNVIKFTKTKDTWFTVWNGSIIKLFENENKHVIAMRRYLDERYDAEAVKGVIERFDARNYKFTTLATLKRFQKQMKLLKKQ